MRRRRNPLSSTEDFVLAGVGVALAAGLAWWAYSRSQLNEEASSSPAVEGNVSTQGTFTNNSQGGWLGGASSTQGESTFRQAPGPVGPTQLPIGPPPVTLS